MLDDVLANGHEDIVSWQPHGKAFRVHKPQEFATLIMPRYFKQTQYKSFQRQLYIYGFMRITGKRMRDNGSYYHEQVIRGQKKLSLRMLRHKPNESRVDYKFGADPDFYADIRDEEHNHKTSSRNIQTLETLRTLDWVHEAQNIISSHPQPKTPQIPKAYPAKSDYGCYDIPESQLIEPFGDGDELFFEGKRFFFASEAVMI
jgi:hypothetical protein